ncbi:MAG TPA: amino acid permease [Planctomycetota bacterium]|nr:amino acid permease [Planctomycetota bacterium]
MSLFEVKDIDAMRADAAGEGSGLRRVLGTKQLVFLGIGAVIGAGIFSTLGDAAAGSADRAGAGPAVVLSFLLLGGVCALAGLCYAEMAAMLPAAGSAYTYSYLTLGRLAAWIVGWNLILEYAIGNVGVAISWSSYLQGVLGAFGVTLPGWLGVGWYDLQEQIATAVALGDAAERARLEAIAADAPGLFGQPLCINLPAVAITAVITMLLVRGIRESARANDVMVLIKLVVLVLFLGVGAFYVDPGNWRPFAPNGWTGIHQGAAIVFFAFIGFDAISTAAEETRDPQRTMPRGILGALAICTLIYMAVGAVATGMLPYAQLKASNPLVTAFEQAHLPAVELIVGLGAVVSMTAVLLVFQLGQPRILMAMARDGLMPRRFGAVHGTYRTPHVATVLTGVFVGLATAVMDDGLAYELCNIGTLLAFASVSLGVLVLRVKRPDLPRPFRVPAVWVVAPLAIAACVYTMAGLPATSWTRFVVWLGIGLVLFFAFARRSGPAAGGVR